MRLLISGGRDYDDTDEVDRVLTIAWRRAAKRSQTLLVIQGGAAGADTLAHDWSLSHGLPCITMDAPWGFFEKKAGPIRNSWMLDFAMPTHFYAFPGGSGTADMTKKAKRAGLKLLKV